jgi:hypothetical protein
MNKLMIGAYLVVILGFAYMLFFKQTGKNINVVLYRWINRKRYFSGIIKGVIKKQFNDSLDEKLMFIAGKKKVWVNTPDSEYFITDTKGTLTIHCVIDPADNVSFIKPDHSTYNLKTIREQVPLLDSRGNKQYTEVYIKDDNGEPELEMVMEAGKPLLDENGDAIYRPKKGKKLLTKMIERKIEEPLVYDKQIASDRKLYYLNKKEEITRKFKREEQKTLWQQLAPMAMIGIIILSTTYLSYKHLKEIGTDISDKQQNFFQNLVEQVRTDTPTVEDVKAKEEEKGKPPDYGEKVD